MDPLAAVEPRDQTLGVETPESAPDVGTPGTDEIVIDRGPLAPVAPAPVATEPAAAPDTAQPAPADKPDDKPAGVQPDPDILALRQEVARLQRVEFERAQREVLANEKVLIDQYQASLVDKGYDPEVVTELVARATNEIALRREISQVKAASNLRITQENERSRVIVAKHLADSFDVPLDVLLSIKTDDPKDLEIAALRYQMEHAKEAEQQAKLQPQRVTGVQGSGGTAGPGSYTQRLKTGQPLPSAEEIDRITAGYLRG